MSFNYVDLGIVLVIVYFAYSGIRRGFVAGVADLVGALVAFLVAIRFYGPASAWLSSVVPWPKILVNFAALIVLFVVGEWLFIVLVTPLLRLIQRYCLPGPLLWVDWILGVVPGLAKGVIFAAALVAMFALFPINAGVRDGVQQSIFGTRLVDILSAAAPSAEAFFGGSLHDTALFVTQPVEEAGPRRMNFPKDIAFREDTASVQAMLRLVNEERLKAGLNPVTLDERLRAVALAHSEDMFRQSYFAHEAPNGNTPADRLRKAGIPYLAMGENLAYAPNVAIAHTGLMNSPGHRANILSPSFGRLGIGVVDGGLYGKMFTQEFTN